MLTSDPHDYSLAQRNARLATWEWTASTDELRWTSGQSEIYSRPVTEINTSQAWAAIVHPEDRERLGLAIERALESRTGFHERFRVSGKNGKTLWILGHAQVHQEPGQPLRMLGVNLDVSDWVDTLRASEARFSATFEQAAVGIAHVGTDGTWLNVNRRCCEIVGYPKEDLLKLTFADITHPDDLDADWALVHALLRGERSTYSMEKRYFAKNSSLVWVNLTVSLVRDPENNPDYFIAVIEDITERKMVEAERDELIKTLEERVRERTIELERLSRTDSLTYIANRRSLDECLAAEWDRAVRTRLPLSVVLIDIDHFKGLNDALGHAVADQALISVGEQLTRIAQRSADFPARYGGDEFVLVLPDTGAEGAARIANQVKDAITRLDLPNPGSSSSPRVTVSQGIATANPATKGEFSSLMLSADRALYKAKHLGRNRISVAPSSKISAEGK
jgi:diguanylate cyclase (GGDEF)-like protein/PAS domain S-box-containing protein